MSHGTPWSETEALMEALEGDEHALRKRLRGMFGHELVTLQDAAQLLLDEIESEMQRKRDVERAQHELKMAQERRSRDAFKRGGFGEIEV